MTKNKFFTYGIVIVGIMLIIGGIIYSNVRGTVEPSDVISEDSQGSSSASREDGVEVDKGVPFIEGDAVSSNGGTSDLSYSNTDNTEDSSVSDETVPDESTDENTDEIVTEPVVETEETSTFDFTVTFTGDVMIASYMNQTSSGNFNDYANNQEPSYFLEKVVHIFENDDYTVVNLENVLTDNNLKEVEKDHNPAYWFRSKTSNTEILTSSSVECVSLANNHFSDYGIQGRTDTKAACDNAGLVWGWNDKTFYIEKNGFKIAVICHGLWGEWQTSEIIPRIKEAEENSDFQIVFYHGGKERLHAPEDWKVRASRKLVDNGADLVVGNHPHVLQPIENYNGVDIIYSMGNFCYGGSKHPENRTIIYQLKLTIDNGVVLEKTADIIPCYVYTGDVNNYQPAPIEDEVEKQRVLDFMNWKVDSPL